MNIKLLTAIIAFSISISCVEKESVKQPDAENRQKIEAAVFKINNGWGYNVFLNGKIYIKQDRIPAVQGNTPFVTQDDAWKTADLMIQKIRKNILPPSITIYELDSLGIKH